MSHSGIDRHERAFQRFKEELQEGLGHDLERLLLYGSVARGEHRSGSDIDVFVVVKREEDKELVYDTAARVGREHGVHIAVVVRTQEEFELTEETAFTREVLDSGRAVV